ncbi:MAG: TonB-dependent receptor [Gemmatimonadaceae bacterium]|nr:TonB-dependent receptor [Gemmatimonadaceae bacterium]
MSRRVVHGVLLSLCAAAVLGAQTRAVADADLPAGYRSLTDASATTGPLAAAVTVNVTQRALGSIILDIARQSHVSFATDPSHPGMDALCDLRVTDVPARDAIQRLLQGTAFRAMVSPTGQIVIARRPTERSLDAFAASQGGRLRLSGYVRSLASREVLRRAQLVVDNDAIRVESNDDGFYSLLLPPGAHRLRVRAIGYAPLDTALTITASVARDILLPTRKVTLAAVTVQADAKGDRPDLDPRTPDMSVVRLDLAAVKLLPTVLGEPDPIRSLTLLPGVSLSSDASTAFSVRGGAADQNLFLLDEATVYNPSHILGFLSTFNADAVDNVTLYKGAIPSKFGGRLSSVVDVRQREGNGNEFTGSASIGLLSGRGLLEGPLPGKLGSYMFAARRSWADLFTGLSSDTSIQNARAYFYDINAKTNVRLGAGGALLLSGYLGRDRFSGGGDFGAGWGNRAVTLRWNQAVSGRLFSKVTAAWGDYDYGLDIVTGTRDSIVWKSRIASVNLKLDETWYVSPTNTIEFGTEVTDQGIRPGDLTPIGAENAYTARSVQQRRTLMPAAWVGQEIQLASRVSVRYGLRYAGYARRGPATLYSYVDDAPVVYSATLGRYEPGVVRDSTRVGRGSRISSAGGFEPRISGRVMVTDASSIKASYSRTQQFLLLVSNTNSISPLDVWEPAGPWIKPQVADQYAIGYSATRDRYELSVEGYVKTARNVVDFIDGADVLLNPRIETQMVQGNGRAYGLELLARRSAGTVTGWISYTLGRSEQRFTVPGNGGVSIGGGINGGRWYPSPFDKTHNLSVVALRPLGPKWTVGATFAFATGLPTTFPTARYLLDGLLVTEYGSRNGGRLPNYHRLDLSATRKYRRGELQFGVLNAYNRFNAQSLRFRQRTNNALVTEAVQTSIFGIVPSVSYAFHF